MFTTLQINSYWSNTLCFIYPFFKFLKPNFYFVVCFSRLIWTGRLAEYLPGWESKTKRKPSFCWPPKNIKKIYKHLFLTIFVIYHKKMCCISMWTNPITNVTNDNWPSILSLLQNHLLFLSHYITPLYFSWNKMTENFQMYSISIH